MIDVEFNLIRVSWELAVFVVRAIFAMQLCRSNQQSFSFWLVYLPFSSLDVHTIICDIFLSLLFILCYLNVNGSKIRLRNVYLVNALNDFDGKLVYIWSVEHLYHRCSACVLFFSLSTIRRKIRDDGISFVLNASCSSSDKRRNRQRKRGKQIRFISLSFSPSTIYK